MTVPLHPEFGVKRDTFDLYTNVHNYTILMGCNCRIIHYDNIKCIFIIVGH